MLWGGAVSMQGAPGRGGLHGEGQHAVSHRGRCLPCNTHSAEAINPRGVSEHPHPHETPPRPPTPPHIPHTGCQAHKAQRQRPGLRQAPWPQSRPSSPGSCCPTAGTQGWVGDSGAPRRMRGRFCWCVRRQDGRGPLVLTSVLLPVSPSAAARCGRGPRTSMNSCPRNAHEAAARKQPPPRATIPTPWLLRAPQGVPCTPPKNKSSALGTERPGKGSRPLQPCCRSLCRGCWWLWAAVGCAVGPPMGAVWPWLSAPPCSPSGNAPLGVAAPIPVQQEGSLRLPRSDTPVPAGCTGTR